MSTNQVDVIFAAIEAVKLDSNPQVSSLGVAAGRLFNTARVGEACTLVAGFMAGVTYAGVEVPPSVANLNKALTDL